MSFEDPLCTYLMAGSIVAIIASAYIIISSGTNHCDLSIIGGALLTVGVIMLVVVGLGTSDVSEITVCNHFSSHYNYIKTCGGVVYIIQDEASLVGIEDNTNFTIHSSQTLFDQYPRAYKMTPL